MTQGFFNICILSLFLKKKISDQRPKESQVVDSIENRINELVCIKCAQQRTSVEFLWLEMMFVRNRQLQFDDNKYRVIVFKKIPEHSTFHHILSHQSANTERKKRIDTKKRQACHRFYTTTQKTSTVYTVHGNVNIYIDFNKE